MIDTDTILMLANIAIGGFISFKVFAQDRSLKFMSSALKGFNPDKILKQQEYLEKATEYKYKLILSNKIRESTEKLGDRLQQENQTIYDQYDELLGNVISVAMKLDPQKRALFLQGYPKTKKNILMVIEAIESGEMEKFQKRKSKHDTDDKEDNSPQK